MDTGLPLIVVNDGSTDQTPEALSCWLKQSSDPHGPERTMHLAHHQINRGKAAALRTGFEIARSLGYTHAATIDTDGQHDPQELPGLVELARRHPTALVLGVRSEKIAGYPGRSLLGRRLSNRLILFECGARISDSQSGLRVYPLDIAARVGARSSRFNFETEVITRWAWAGFSIVETPITSRYLPAPDRISHFRPCVDTARSIVMHVRLVGTAVTRRLTLRQPSRPDKVQRPTLATNKV